MGEWRETTLGEMATFQRGFDITQDQQVPGSVPVISSGGIKSFHSEAMSPGPGVVIGRKGSLGTVFYSEGPYWPHDTTLWVKDFHGNNPRFVYYFMRGFDVGHLDNGTSNPTLNRNHLHPIRVRWPDMATQDSIVDLLGAIDDKIVANKKATLTALNLALSVVKVSAADHRVPLGELAHQKREQADPRSISDHEVQHFSLPAFDQGCHPVIEDPRSIKSSKFAIRRPSVLFSKLNPHTPRIWLVHPYERMRSYASTEFVVLEPRECSAEMLWLACAQSELSGELAGLARGTSNSHQRVSPSDILERQVIDPSKLPGAVIDECERTMKLAASLHEEIPRLIAVREALLPNLLNGNLAVRAADNLLSQTV